MGFICVRAGIYLSLANITRRRRARAHTAQIDLLHGAAAVGR
jgi:hypothetical protein